MTVIITCHGEGCRGQVLTKTPEADNPFLGPALLGAIMTVNLHKKDTGHSAKNMRIESEKSLVSLKDLGAIIQIFVNPLNIN